MEETKEHTICYHCGKEFYVDPRYNTFNVVMKNKQFSLCSEKCQIAMNNFLGFLISDI